MVVRTTISGPADGDPGDEPASSVRGSAMTPQGFSGRWGKARPMLPEFPIVLIGPVFQTTLKCRPLDIQFAGADRSTLLRVSLEAPR